MCPEELYFYTEDSIIEANDYELISKNLEYPNQAKEQLLLRGVICRKKEKFNLKIVILAMFLS